MEDDRPIKSISDVLKQPRKKQAQSERAELIGWFTDELNVARVRDGFRRLSPGYVGTKVAHLSMEDLYYLKSVMKDASRRNYSASKVFFGSLKPKK